LFAAVLIASGRYRRGGAPASAWLFGIAQHKLVSSRRRGTVEDRARRRLRMAPIELEDEDPVTGRETAPLRVDGSTVFLAADANYVYVYDSSSQGNHPAKSVIITREPINPRCR
jgi:DNA-directed RNA polymerase specialized sigma24 family protein